MTLVGFLVLLVVAAVAGALGQALAGYSLGGCLVSIIVGWVGAYIGMWLAGVLGLPEFLVINIQGEAFPLVWATIGAAVLSAIIGLLTRPYVIRR
jgi:uncharacterized membrane protein YeaQ/YmgE (transglycosylase-associated protein family)